MKQMPSKPEDSNFDQRPRTYQFEKLSSKQKFLSKQQEIATKMRNTVITETEEMKDRREETEEKQSINKGMESHQENNGRQRKNSHISRLR